MADRLDGGIGHQLSPEPAGPLDKEYGGVARRERFQPILLFARHVQWGPAGYEQLKSARGREQGAHRRSGIEEMLEVVEQDQELLAAEESDEVVARSHCLPEFRGHEFRVGQPGERHPEDAVAEPATSSAATWSAEAGLTGSSRPGDGQKPRAAREQRDELVRPPAPSLRAGSRRRAGWWRQASCSGGKSPSPSW